MQLYLQSSIFASFTVLNLVNDILDMAKMESSSFVINKELFNMIEVVS